MFDWFFTPNNTSSKVSLHYSFRTNGVGINFMFMIIVSGLMAVVAVDLLL